VLEVIARCELGAWHAAASERQSNRHPLSLSS
jgi:hypothetical protein